ncbi:MAG: hypothetical protein ACI9S8_003260 [Chlamydiales bacterium]|jgi:hypothetical protein
MIKPQSLRNQILNLLSKIPSGNCCSIDDIGHLDTKEHREKESNSTSVKIAATALRAFKHGSRIFADFSGRTQNLDDNPHFNDFLSPHSPASESSTHSTSPSMVGPNTQSKRLVRLLNQLKIKSSLELQVLMEQNSNEILKAFSPDQSPDKSFEIFKDAINTFEKTTDIKIGFSATKTRNHFNSMMRKADSMPSMIGEKAIPARGSINVLMSDIDRIQESYDRLDASRAKVKETSSILTARMKKGGVVSVPRVVIGAGDSATSLWIAKYGQDHKQDLTRSTEMPDTLFLAKNQGIWGHDYTLAQPHNLLERPGVANPHDFTRTSTYKSNNYVNARHLRQSNDLIQGQSNMPILPSTVETVEKKSNHEDDWECSDRNYRIKINLTDEEGHRYVYTDSVEICAGLGVGRDIFPGSYISPKAYAELSIFDPEKGFTPICDGNRFMLTSEEEQGEKNRVIINYGGGGNATACYRKANFDQDRGVRDLNTDEPVNTVHWFSRNGFGDAGYGTKATEAVKHAAREDNKNSLNYGELSKIEKDPDSGKLKVTFTVYTPVDPDEHQTEGTVIIRKSLNGEDLIAVVTEETTICDQFIFSTGQDSTKVRQLTSELGELKEKRTSDVVTGVSNDDGAVTFYGASATAVHNIFPEFRKDIIRNNLCPDAEWPGVMPPSRAQVAYAASHDTGRMATTLNVNTDEIELIKTSLQASGADEWKVTAFVAQILFNRKMSDSGVTPQFLRQIFEPLQFGDAVSIVGLTSLQVK